MRPFSPIAALLALAAATPAAAQNVRQLGAAASPPAAVSAFAWMAGRWTGEGLGGVLEEVYSPPAAGLMVGHFSARDQTGPQFMELITLREEKGSVTLRLRHFEPDLKAWEGPAKTVDFPLVAIEGDRFYFDGLTIERIGRDEVRHYILLRDAGGPVRETVTRYRRAR